LGLNYSVHTSSLWEEHEPGARIRIVGPHEIGQGGDGIEYLAKLKALARPLGSRCEFIGPIFDQEALIREYHDSSVFVYPSLAETGESFGVAPVEAMAAGCATVVSSLKCFDDYIEHEVTGLKFNHRNPLAAVDLASQLVRLATEPGLLERMAEAGHHAARKFQSAVIAARMIEDFKSLGAGRAGSRAQPVCGPPVGRLTRHRPTACRRS